MGGINSGRYWPTRKQTTQEALLVIDVKQFTDAGHLKSNSIGILSPNHEHALRVAFEANYDEITLTYWAGHKGEDLTHYHYSIELYRTACNYGGERPWFVCPTILCGRRCRKLYLSPTDNMHFLCRECLNLAYESQREGYIDRMLRKAAKYKLKINWDTSLLAPPYTAPPPEGMHEKTFDRYAYLSIYYTDLAWQAMGYKYPHRRLLESLGKNLKPKGSY